METTRRLPTQSTNAQTIRNPSTILQTKILRTKEKDIQKIQQKTHPIQIPSPQSPYTIIKQSPVVELPVSYSNRHPIERNHTHENDPLGSVMDRQPSKLGYNVSTMPGRVLYRRFHKIHSVPSRTRINRIDGYMGGNIHSPETGWRNDNNTMAGHSRKLSLYQCENVGSTGQMAQTSGGVVSNFMEKTTLSYESSEGAALLQLARTVEAIGTILRRHGTRRYQEPDVPYRTK